MAGVSEIDMGVTVMEATVQGVAGRAGTSWVAERATAAARGGGVRELAEVVPVDWAA